MKNSRLEIRLSKEEKEIIKENSKKLGFKNVSEFILALCSKVEIDINTFPSNCP